MLRYLRFIFIGVTGIVLLTLALANRGQIELRLLPEGMGNMLGLGASWTVPLFVVLLGAVAIGVAVGFVWEWLREMRIRQTAKSTTKTVARLEKELAVLRDSNSAPAQDTVLTILADGAKK